MMKHQLKQILSTLLVIAMITGSFCGIIPSAENISNYIESVADGEADEELLHNHAEASTSCQSTTYQQKICPDCARWRDVRIGHVPVYVCKCASNYSTLSELNAHIAAMKEIDLDHYNGYRQPWFADKDNYPYVVNGGTDYAYVVGPPCSTCHGKGYTASVCGHGHEYTGTVTYPNGATRGGTGATCGVSCDLCIAPTPTPTPTNTNTPIPTNTNTPTNTPTKTNTPTPTNTSVGYYSPTKAPTSAPTKTNTPRPTNTSTPTPTAAPTNTPVPAGSHTHTDKCYNGTKHVHL